MLLKEENAACRECSGINEAVWHSRLGCAGSVTPLVHSPSELMLLSGSC